MYEFVKAKIDCVVEAGEDKFCVRRSVIFVLLVMFLGCIRHIYQVLYRLYVY